MQPRRAAAPSSLSPILAAVIALIPFVGGFSTTNVFFVRDLGMYFWPRHLWAWQSWRNRDWPLWDPYAGAGQSAVADALNNFFLLPVTIVRAITPAVVGFNFWVAAPFPVLAAGMWCWLRNRLSPPAAFAGAAIVALAGPIVSAGNFPNLSWTVAFIPWILWCVDRLCDLPRFTRMAAMATCVGLQAIAGEPVTFLTTSALVVGYVVVAAPAGGVSQLWRRLVWIGSGLATGVLLAAIQLVPLGFAASRSMRGENIDYTFWSLHPLSLLELVVPHLFGHAYHGNLETLPWVRPLNGGREPLFYSLYLGLAVCVLALIRSSDSALQRWRVFWWAAFALSLLAALGEYTVAYSAASSILPVLKTLRFPVKYFVLGAFALSALAASGVDTLFRHYREGKSMARPAAALTLLAITGLAGGVLGGATAFGAESMSSAWEALAGMVDVDDAVDAARWMQGTTALWMRLSMFAVVVAVLLTVIWRRHRFSPVAAWTMCGLAVLDPVSVNFDLHPTMPASQLGPPEWYEGTRAHPDDRVYVGGRVGRATGRQRGPTELVDGPHMFQARAEWSVQEAQTMNAIQYAYTPSAWRIREVISYDLPQLWPREYVMMLRTLRNATPQARLQYLRRVGVRYCFMQEPPYSGAIPIIVSTIAKPMALYECHTEPLRVYVSELAVVEPDLDRQIEALFREDHDPRSTVLLQRPSTTPEGQPGIDVAAPTARVASERNTELVVRADVGANGGYLSVLDSYDPFWVAHVDGRPAAVLRANGLFRAVHLAPGRHEVRFSYRPTPFYAGLGITGVAALILVFGCFREQIGRPVRPVVYQNEV